MTREERLELWYKLRNYLYSVEYNARNPRIGLYYRMYEARGEPHTRCIEAVNAIDRDTDFQVLIPLDSAINLRTKAIQRETP